MNQRRSSRRDDDIEHRQKRRSRVDDITDRQLVDYVSEKAAKLAKKFNNSNPFIWRKKIERDVSCGKPVLDMISVKNQKRKQTERVEEIQKLKKRREERAVIKAQRQEEAAMLTRERAKAEMLDWEKREEEFLFQQAKIRSEIRLHQGRAKPIDLLSQYINASNVVIAEPSYMVFQGMTIKEMEELRGEIQLCLKFNRATPRHVEFWESVMVVCDWELAEARRKDAKEVFVERGIHSSIEEEVESFLQGRTCKELEDLQRQTEVELRTGNAKVVEFWEAVLKRLSIYKAKACLKEIHAEMFDHEVQQYNTQAVLSPTETIKAEENMKVKAMKAMEEGDIMLDSAAEVNLEVQVEQCDDEYQPRKPLYFNTMRAGYEWNKYNRVHYDHDNPPPKTVHGYKFNIFYPGLLEKSRIPSYEIMKDGNSVKTCIIRFHAGPPYEDIAFRIVNKEWRRSKRDGFKCTFEGGVLRLYFNLERYRYRR